MKQSRENSCHGEVAVWEGSQRRLYFQHGSGAPGFRPHGCDDANRRSQSSCRHGFLGYGCVANPFGEAALARTDEVVMREEEMPELFHSPYGEKTHTSRTCTGLRNATHVSRHTPCAVCCPGGLRMKEQRMVEYRRSFWEAAGRFLWLKVFLIVILMSTSWFMIFEVNHNFGFPLSEDRVTKYQEAALKKEDVRNESEPERNDTPVEEVPTGKSQEGDHVEMFTTWS